MIDPFKDVNWRPNDGEMREFGRTLIFGFAVIAVVLSALVRWKTGEWRAWPVWLGLVGVGLGAVCWLMPRVARPVYVLWYAVGSVIGMVLSNVLLGLVFYLVITPIGVALRCLGKDPLERRLDRQASTYWKDAEKPVDATRYFRQF